MSFEAMEKELREYVKQDRYNFIKGHFEEEAGARYADRSDAVDGSGIAGVSRRSAYGTAIARTR